MLKEYIKQFGISKIAEENKIIELGDRFFIEPDNFDIKDGIIYAGRYLGMRYNNKFVPSIDLLWMIKEKTRQWIIVNKKAEWLVICGRDIFGASVAEKGKDFRRDERVLILTEEKEPIGVGRIVDERFLKDVVAVKMQFDIGDLIRRGKRKNY